MQTQPLSQTFDEQSALAELEQLADKIQLSRRQREQKVAEFDAFVRTFRQDQRVQSIAATERELRRAEDRPSVVSAATHAAQAAVPVTDPMAMEVAASIPETVPWSAATAREPIAPVSVARSARPRAAYVGVVLAALALLAVGVLLWRSAITPVGPAAQPDARSLPADVACARRARSSGGSAGATTRADCESAESPQRRVPYAPAGLGACHRRWPPRCRKGIRRRRAHVVWRRHHDRHPGRERWRDQAGRRRPGSGCAGARRSGLFPHVYGPRWRALAGGGTWNAHNAVTTRVQPDAHDKTMFTMDS